MTWEITLVDRARWQREAVRELAAALAAHDDLPVIAWTVAPAGGGLAGRISGLAPAAGVRAAFTAWQQALGLDEVTETASAGGGVSWLRARAWRGGVRVTMTAAVFAPGGHDENAVTS